MKKMKLSFITTVLLVLASAIGHVAYGQAVVTQAAPSNPGVLDSETAVWRLQSKAHLNQNQYNFVSQTEALELLNEELLSLNATTPSGGLEEATHAVKKLFLIGATSVLKQGGTVEEALIAGVIEAGVAASGYSVVDDDYPLDLLEFYADLVSN